MVNSAQNAPYAPAANVLTVIQRCRDRGLPDPLNASSLEQVGIPTGNAPRTLQALRFLGLIDDEGRRTPALERLRRASTDEYPSVLAEVVQVAYQPIFGIVDPSQDDEVAISDAFRHYEPAAQRGRMVTLFVTLCREAGIVPSEGRRRRRSLAVRQPTPSRRTARKQPEESSTPMTEERLSREAESVGPDYRLISALIQQLPKSGKWTIARRNRWVQAMTSALDLLIEVSDGQEES